MPIPELDRALGAHVRFRSWRHDGPATALYPSGAHAAVELSWVERGAATYHARGADVVVGPGAAIAVPPSMDHRTAFGSSLRASALWLSLEMVGEIADAVTPDDGARGFGFGVVRRSARVLALGRLLEEEVRGGAEGHVLVAESLAEAIVVELLRHAPREHARGARDARIRQALERMRACYAEDLSVDELAKGAGMSRFHFSRLFRDEVGDAPYKHLLRIRVARAAELLRKGRHTVTEAAFAVGFQDMSRFSRMFRAELGVNPRAYRARSA